MELRSIYRPIENDLKRIDEILDFSLKKSKSKPILGMGKFLLESPGKRIRPALVILSARASSDHRPFEAKDSLTKIASAMELIHMASLVHDDVIDHAGIRHNKPTVNSRWGEDVSIALGDYLFAEAFELISGCGNSDIIRCLSSATKTMCEGELLQVCERDNLDLLKERYLVIIKKKTAMFFASSCHAGALISDSNRALQKALKAYGLNFGIAFQIVDDYLDLIGAEENLGKMPGQDVGVGEMTLPILNLLESVSGDKRKELKELLSFKNDRNALDRIKTRLFEANIGLKTKKLVSSYMDIAKSKIEALSDSPYKESLLNLADFVIDRGFNAQG